MDAQKYNASQNLSSLWGNIAPAEVPASYLFSGKCGIQFSMPIHSLNINE